LAGAESFVALYAGAHGRANAIDQLIGAAEELRGRQDILIASVGDGTERKRLICDPAGAGIFAEPENPRAITEAIRRLAGEGSY
jgi:hypothetical protein